MQAAQPALGAPLSTTPPQPVTVLPKNRHSILLDTVRPVLAQSIINPKKGMEEGGLQQQTPRPPRPCSTKPCWSLDMRVAVLLLTVAGAIIFLLVYRLLKMRQRLRHALGYYSFYHTATYTLRDPRLPQVPPAKNGNVSEATAQVTAIVITPLPPPPPTVSPPPSLPLPPPPIIPPPTHPLQPTPLHPPTIHTTPPSPHLSWGASSEADVYSRIGVFRPSRLSRPSSQTQVILFEHSSL